MHEDDATIAEAGEAARLAAMKSKVGNEVNAEIQTQATRSNATDDARVDNVAAGMRAKALDETVDRDRTVGHARTAARGSQFIDFAFYALYTLLGVRLVLALIAARSSNGFVQMINTVTNPFYAPFKGIVDSPEIEGGSTFVLPIVVAIVAYVLLHLAINGILRMVGSRKTSI